MERTIGPVEPGVQGGIDRTPPIRSAHALEHGRGLDPTTRQRFLRRHGTLTIDVRRNVLAGLAREITVGRDKQVRIVWKEAGELAVDYAIGALPELRVSVIKALPAPRMTVSDLLATAQRELAGAVK